MPITSPSPLQLSLSSFVGIVVVLIISANVIMCMSGNLGHEQCNAATRVIEQHDTYKSMRLFMCECAYIFTGVAVYWCMVSKPALSQLRRLLYCSRYVATMPACMPSAVVALAATCETKCRAPSATHLLRLPHRRLSGVGVASGPHIAHLPHT